MNIAKWFWGMLMLAVLAASCQRQQVKTIPPTDDPKEVTLKKIESLVDLADIQAQADVLESDQTYLMVFQLLDSLRSVYPGDSSLSLLQDSLQQRYEQIVAPEETEEDSLSAELVLEELGLIYQDVSDSALAISRDSLLAVPRDSIPVVMNRNVKRAIKYFTEGRGRRVFARWLQRAERWDDLILPILREEGAPEDLFYLAMIESGLNPKAHSYARALGMWQFIYATGKAYGLQRSWWFDDRRDPVKATRAAARHLLDLYDRFGDWYLGIAGYNFNPRKIEKRMARYNVSEFWDLPRLPRQTRNYVPTFLAALTIAKNPAKYGFEVTPEEAVKFDTVTVKECVDLNVVAECVGSTFAEIKELNPALLRFCTPPDQDRWLLNLPHGTRETFLKNYAKTPPERKVSWVRHRIRSGETLSTIARKYRVSVSEIKRFNRIRGTMIRAGHNLVIPVPQNKKYYQNYLAAQRRTRSYRKPKPVANVPGREKHVYIVKKGDSLWEVAARFGVTLTQLRKWNGLGYSRIIRPGQTLNIWLPPGQKKASAQPASSLARQVSPIPAPGVQSRGNEGRLLWHTVRPGDTLWDIAQSYNVSIRDIKRWNGMRSNTIRPGDQLKIFTE